MKEIYMERAIELAYRGMGKVNPNPMVGAVLVKDGRIIGEGWHEAYGMDHAEIHALKGCSGDPEGATLYVTLEPCCHYGKKPPCTEAILQSKIAKVVVGTKDVNPLVAGKGIRALQDHGVEVAVGMLEEKCRELVRIFSHYMVTDMPYLTMKYAMTMDGKIATRSRESKWITGEESREQVQELRGRSMGIMVGVETLLADDPMLNIRKEEARQPIRIICDSRLRTSLDSRVAESAKEFPTILATISDDEEKRRALEEKGITVLLVAEKEGRVDLLALMRELGRRGMDSVLLEGGGTLNEAALRAGLVDEVHVYMAPKIIGGCESLTPVEGAGVTRLEEAYPFALHALDCHGEDIHLTYRRKEKACLQD